MKTAITGLLSLALAGNSIAANVHFNHLPTFELLGGGAVRANLSLAGLGNKDIVITVTVDGEATVIYTNPGGNEAPGQNKVPVQSVGSASIPSEQIKNGNVEVSIDTSELTAPPAPNPNWTTTITDIVYSSVTVTVEQHGKVVLSETFDFVP